MLSCSLLFSDPFFLLNTLHYSLIFRFVKQFFKKYYVFSLKIVKIYFLTQKTRIFIIEEKAQNQKASYNEDSFAMLDDVLDWCETYQVYAVVDFHAATAGQSGIPCDDGVDNGQHLYDDEESMERMFLLMEEFMRRYKDRWIIGAYDCINEPISMTPRREELTPKLVYFYEEIVQTKRLRYRQLFRERLFLKGVMPPAGEKVTSDVHPYFAYETAPNTLERFTLGTVTGEGILKIEVLDGCARFGQIVIRKSEK